MQVVVLRSLILLSFFVSTALTHHAFDRVFIRGRDMWQTYALAVIALSLAWEFYKFTLFHVGTKLAHHVTPSKARAGSCAIGVAAVMMVGSVATVSHGMQALLAPSVDEAAGREQHREQAEQERVRERLWGEHAALVGTKQLTRAREVAEQIRSLEQAGTGRNSPEQPGTEIERDRTRSEYYQYLPQPAMVALCWGIGALVEILSLVCVWLHAVSSKTSDVPAHSAAFPAVPARSQSSTHDDVLEEIRTGRIPATTKAVQLRMRCGGVKASAVLAEAKSRGLVPGQSAKG